MPRPRPTDGTAWEDRHRQVAFYCPVDLLELLNQQAASSGRSKTQVVVDALRAHLDHPDTAS